MTGKPGCALIHPHTFASKGGHGYGVDSSRILHFFRSRSDNVGTLQHAKHFASLAHSLRPCPHVTQCKVFEQSLPIHKVDYTEVGSGHLILYIRAFRVVPLESAQQSGARDGGPNASRASFASVFVPRHSFLSDRRASSFTWSWLWCRLATVRHYVGLCLYCPFPSKQMNGSSAVRTTGATSPEKK